MGKKFIPKIIGKSEPNLRFGLEQNSASKKKLHTAILQSSISSKCFNYCSYFVSLNKTSLLLMPVNFKSHTKMGIINLTFLALNLIVLQ